MLNQGSGWAARLGLQVGWQNLRCQEFIQIFKRRIGRPGPRKFAVCLKLRVREQQVTSRDAPACSQSGAGDEQVSKRS